MKLLLLAALASSTVAFAPSSSGRTTVALHAAGSADIEAALAASKEFGPTSKEARVLWDIVEEMDASDNSVATKAPVVDVEYESKVKALSEMLAKTKGELDQVRKLADELKGVKLASPPSTTGGTDMGDAMTSALTAARAATDAHGVSSPEARLAWEAVEEIAARATDGEASKPTLDEECLIELIEGCEALEKFKETLDAMEAAE